MPIYEYRCEDCGHQLEALQKMTDAPLRDCPECGKPTLKKQVSAAGFRLSGSGWYETDFKSGNKRNIAEKELMSALRRYFIAGLLVWVPLMITILVIRVLVGMMDKSLLLLPPAWRPEALLGMKIPGLGVALTVLVVFLTGLVVANFAGRRLVRMWESLLARIPLVRTIHSAVKQVMETVFSSGSDSFRKVLLIEYPRKGVWTIAFQTGELSGEIPERIERDAVTVFVPTTPNPTSGFVIVVPREELIELDMSVEEGLKLIMSLGVVTPGRGRDLTPELAPGRGRT